MRLLCLINKQRQVQKGVKFPSRFCFLLFALSEILSMAIATMSKRYFICTSAHDPEERRILTYSMHVYTYVLFVYFQPWVTRMSRHSRWTTAAARARPALLARDEHPCIAFFCCLFASLCCVFVDLEPDAVIEVQRLRMRSNARL